MMLIPVTMKSPSPPPPMKGARVAPARTCTEAVRAPANMAGAASQTRILRKTCPRLIPMPVAGLHGVRIDIAQADVGVQPEWAAGQAR